MTSELFRMPRSTKPTALFFAIATILTFICGPTSAIAGGGPENALIVVNADSDSSKLIANQYISLRNIPDKNVVYLTGIPYKEAIEYEKFEEAILRPVLAAIEDRNLAGSIDYILYSSDFPTTIRIREFQQQYFKLAEQNGAKLTKTLYRPEASITSLTYLAGFCIHAPWRTLEFRSNRYFRIPTAQMLRAPFVGPDQQEFERSIKAFDSEEFDPQFEAAIESLLRLAKQNPGQTAVLYWLAKFYAKKGDSFEATRWMTRAIGMGWSDRSGTLADPHFSTIVDPGFEGLVKRMTNEGRRDITTRSFRQLYQWGPNGMLNSTAGQGDRYFLSTVLAVTRNDGNTEAEAVRQLIRSTSADFTRPNGTFYFTDTNDVRTKTRRGKFQQAVNALQDLGYRAEIIKTNMPMEKDDILGLTSGIAQFKFAKTNSSILPGSICENLTSFGGRLGSIGGQTKLNEFLRFGAAGSSGTVTEPYTVPNKFPDPMIHVHYARGCSLAEAFYQSLYGPFQTLIVGDALCQPFATPPLVVVGGITPMETVSGKTQLTFDRTRSPVRVAGMELFIDGVMKRRDRSFDPIDFDTANLSDGYHEIRVVFVGSNRTQTTSRAIIPMVINNNGKSCTLEADKQFCGFEDSLSLSFSADGASEIKLVQHSRVLAKVDSESGVFELSAKEIGRGKTAIRAIATVDGVEISSVPLNLQVNGPLAETRPRTSKPKPKPEKKTG